ncbi:MAG: hypothetical protein ACRDBY_14020 [Cetobacterium sp.]
MDMNLTLDTLLTNGIFCAIFVWYLTKNETRQEKGEEKQETRYKELREDFKLDKERMYVQLEKNSQILESQGNALIKITNTLSTMSKDIDELKARKEGDE